MTAGLLALIHKISGSMLVVVGMIVLPMPIPLGLIMIALGLALLAPYFVPVRRFVRSMRGRYPKFDDAMRKFKHRVPPVIRATIEKTCPKTTSDHDDVAEPS